MTFQQDLRLSPSIATNPVYGVAIRGRRLICDVLAIGTPDRRQPYSFEGQPRHGIALPIVHGNIGASG